MISSNVIGVIFVGFCLLIILMVFFSLYFLIVLIIMVVIAINFAFLSIKITPEAISVGYGVFKSKIRWETIDHAIAIYPPQRWRHWGVQFDRDKGKWNLGYIAADVNLPRVLISLNEGRAKEIEFSTKRQGELLDIINQILWNLKKNPTGNELSQLSKELSL